MKLGKVKYAQQCVERWNEWKELGLEPKTRAAALKVISDERGKDLKAIRKAYSNFNENGEETISSALSFAVWDLTENSGKALDYSTDANWLTGVLSQASNFIYTYTRVQPVRPAGVKSIGTDPTYTHVPGHGAMPIRKLTPKQFEIMVDSALADAKTKMLRWKALGASRPALVKKLTALSVAVIGEYEESLSA